jgi:chromate transporter
MTSSTVPTLIWIFAPLSVVSIGGGPSVIAEMQHQSVVAHGWVTQREFADLFAISRAAPGPGALLAPMIGWKAAGWPGVFVVSLAFFFPSGIFVYGASRVWDGWRGSPLVKAIELGLGPIAMGLILAGAYSILRSEPQNAAGWATALLIAACRITIPSLHPLLMIAVGAAAFPLFNS